MEAERECFAEDSLLVLLPQGLHLEDPARPLQRGAGAGQLLRGQLAAGLVQVQARSPDRRASCATAKGASSAERKSRASRLSNQVAATSGGTAWCAAPATGT